MQRERPIIMSAPMVRAILEGRKLQTRRVVKPQPAETTTAFRDIPDTPYWFGEEFYPDPAHGDWKRKWKCPYGVPGDRLWVRETWQAIHWLEEECRVPETIPSSVGDGCYWHAEYRADSHPETFDDRGWPWRPAIHMPRWASRITLEITEVRVQRLQEISEEDAKAEGCRASKLRDLRFPDIGRDANARLVFSALWDSINEKKQPWSTNPWVWAISFRRIL